MNTNMKYLIGYVSVIAIALFFLDKYKKEQNKKIDATSTNLDDALKILDKK